MATALFNFGILNGDCQIDLVYDTVSLAVSAVQVINPSTSMTVTLTAPNGRVFSAPVPVSAVTKQFNIPKNLLTLILDPVDNVPVLPNGWSTVLMT